MAAPSLQTLQRLAADTGYQPGTLEKVLRLLDLLQEIKGGHAQGLADRLDPAARWARELGRLA